MTGPTQVLVDKQSATRHKEGESNLEHMIPISATHSDLVKFAHNEDGVVKATLRTICRRIVGNLAQNVQHAEGTCVTKTNQSNITILISWQVENIP